ncbi:MAG: response regulator [Deltaproteobacteria bacterium]|nr:response regulator [Deltaproteobacteria bacterium]
MARRIVLVDDDKDYSELIALLLERHGYAVVRVTDGKQAMQAVQTEPPDALITDCFLPRMDGVHLCKFLRADPKFRALPMLLMSGVLDNEILARCKEFGINAVYEKGTPLENLVKEVDRLFKQP